jgi:enoyl-CoA hydratase
VDSCAVALRRSKVACDAATGGTEFVVIEVEPAGPDGGVAVLRLAHGTVNAMDLELCEALAASCREAASARAVVLTGAGRAFSAGVDLHRVLDGGTAYVERFLPALGEAFRALFSIGKPVVAALNGHAIAGGCVLAAAADVTLMADGPGRIGVPEIRVGVPFPRIALEILRYKAGEVAARKLVLGARNHTPAEAAALGLVDEVAEPGALRGRAVESAIALAEAVPPDTFALTKAQLHRDALDRTARFANDAEVLALWSRRVTDGWLARFVASFGRR